MKRRAGPIDYISDHSDLDHSDLDQGAAGRRPTPSDQEIGGSPSRRFFCAPGYSSHDDWSDGPFSTAKPRPLSPSVHDISPFRPIERPMHSQCQPKDRTLDFGIPRNPEKVICHGYLQGLRIEGGVRQWKRLWTVLRPKSLAFYKNDQEYSAIKIIPMTQVIDAAEIDPLSRSKNFCFQIIVEEKSYRLCAPDEESFDKWLGCLKSIIVVIRQNSKASNPITPA